VRILFLHEVNYLTKPIFEMHEFPEHLAKLGHEVGFVHFPEGYSLSQIRKLGRRKAIPGRVVEGVKIDLFTPWTFSGNLLGRLFTAKFFFWQFRRILREYEPDVVVSFSVPTSGWQALIATRHTKTPYVFRALDVSHRIRKGPFSRLVKGAERFVYRRADGLSANSPAMLKYCELLSPRHGMSAVHNPPLDLDAFMSGNRGRGRDLIGLAPTDKVVLYMGSFFYFSGLPEVIKAFGEGDNGIKLVLVGGGEQDSELRRLAADVVAKGQVVFTGMVSFDELPDVLAAADVAINPMEKTLVSDTALPNKVLQYMASGVPVVSTRLNGLLSTFGLSSGITWGSTPREVAQLAINLSVSSELEALSLSGTTAIASFKANSNPVRFEEFLEQVISKS
jgi:glycosyltransferase involved in cell wall biosynthesis